MYLTTELQNTCRLNIVKISIPPNWSTDLTGLKLKFLKDFLCIHRQADPKIPMEIQKTQNNQNKFEKNNNKIWGMRASNFKSYYKAPVL